MNKPLAYRFSCVRCHQHKPMLGRKAKFVLGVRGFACADCVKKEAKSK